MREVLIFLVQFLIAYIVLGVSMAVIWSYCFSSRYWAWRERLEKKKQKKLEEKMKKLNK